MHNMKTKGVSSLLITIILLVSITLLVLFASNNSFMRQKMTSNQNRNQQALLAAEAGLEFAIPYFDANSAAILESPVNGYLQAFSNSDITNVPLANGSQFSITYTNPIQNNFDLIHITVTGVSDDGSSTRNISEDIQGGSLIFSVPNMPLITKGNVLMGGSVNITNTHTNQNIHSGLGVVITGSAKTITNAGVVSSGGIIGSDITQNDISLLNLSESAFFESFFGVNSDIFKSSVNTVYQNNQNTNYSALLAGQEGKSFWIDQTAGEATLSGNTIIGSETNPVLLIVNGNLHISGNVEIYGALYVMGATTTEIFGSVTIHGSVITTNTLNLSGNTDIIYDPTTLDNLQQALKYYAKVPGSWKDF